MRNHSDLCLQNVQAEPLNHDSITITTLEPLV